MQYNDKDLWFPSFKEVLNVDVESDISDVLRILSKAHAINDITYSIYNVVWREYSFMVIIEVKCFDYDLNSKRKGYYGLEYLKIEEREFIHTKCYSRSMPIEVKIAAHVPYGGWYKDERQVADEENYDDSKPHSPANAAFI